MASYVTNEDIWYKKASETRNGLISFADALDKDNSVNETISSITSVTPSPAGPTVSNAAVTTVPRIIRGVEVPAGKGIQITVSGGSNGTTYSLECRVVSSGGQIIERNQTLIIQAT